jgi:uncharacterized protein (DUF1015 family)
MATIIPFCALHPSGERAASVAAVPYDVVDVEEARALAADNPLSFLHVSRAEIDLPADTDPYSARVYETAAARFATLRRAAPLLRDEEACLYVYRLRAGDHEQTGVAGCCSLDDYDADVIKKHESTRPAKVEDRTRHMIALGAQTGPVFLTYRAQPAVDDVVSRATVGAPLCDFDAPDGVRHTVWRAGQRAAAALEHAFAAIPALYIADGHHRAASAARVRSELGGSNRAAATFLSVAFPDNQVRILPYNRVVKDLGGRSAEAFLEAVKARLIVTRGEPRPERSGRVSMYLAGQWHTLEFDRPNVSGSDAAGTLDVSILQDRVLTPILGIADVRTDPRIDFVGGARTTRELERLVNDGRAMVAFSMHPVSVAELMAISDAGQMMPPKSTWFEPKLRDGLLVHEL